MRSVAIVTAGDTPQSAVLSQGLARLGHDVALLFGEGAKREAEKTAKSLSRAAARGEAIGCDLADPASIVAALAAIKAQFGRPASILVNNAARIDQDDIATVSAESLRDHFGINLFAAVQLTRGIVADKRAEEPGLIVNILHQSDSGGGRLSASLANYALHGFTMTMARRLAPSFRVCAIAPGGLGEPKPEDIAAALEFIVANPGLTGQVLRVDGPTPGYTGSGVFAIL